MTQGGELFTPPVSRFIIKAHVEVIWIMFCWKCKDWKPNL